MNDDMEFKGRVIRNSTQEVKVHQGRYYGIEVLDVRWYKDEKPTRKGIRLNMLEAKVLYRILTNMFEGEEE